MSQWGTQACALAGLQWGAILRRYYFSHPLVILDDAPASTQYYQSGDAWHEQIYALGRNRTVYEKFYNFSTGQWRDWATVGGSCTSAPATIGTGSIGGYRYLYVLCRWVDAATGDAQIYQTRWNGSSWSGWQNLYGNMQSGPAATTYYQTGDAWHLQLYALGWNGEIWEKFFNFSTGQWYGWGSLGGSCTSAPAAFGTDAIGGYRYLYVLCRWTNGAMYEKHWNGYTWSNWASLAGDWTSGPAATPYNQPGDGWRFNVYATGLNGAVYEKFFRTSTGQWSGWSSLGGQNTSAPAANSYSPSDLRVHARGRDDPSGGGWNRAPIYYRQWNGSTWAAWQYIGAPP